MVKYYWKEEEVEINVAHLVAKYGAMMVIMFIADYTYHKFIEGDHAS